MNLSPWLLMRMPPSPRQPSVMRQPAPYMPEKNQPMRQLQPNNRWVYTSDANAFPKILWEEQGKGVQRAHLPGEQKIEKKTRQVAMPQHRSGTAQLHRRPGCSIHAVLLNAPTVTVLHPLTMAKCTFNSSGFNCSTPWSCVDW